MMHRILENPLLRKTHEYQRAALLERFPELAHSSNEYFLALHKYIGRTPYCFYSDSIYTAFLTWLEDREGHSRVSLEEYLRVHDAELNRAFLHLEEINGLNWHDHFEHVDDYELIRFIDRQIHPTYLRLVEGVLSPLCRIISHFSRTDRGRGTEGLDTWSIMEELERTTLRQVRGLYKHIVRNAIAHGGITFLQREIRYTDKKGDQEKYGDLEIIRMCDDLLDGCNALALALSLFLLSRPPARYHLPQQLLLSELREETATPWWEISGCTLSEFAGLNQLIVYARPKTADYAKVQLSTFQSGVLAERFAPGYSRYFFSIRSASSLPGWAAFKGGMLRELRLKSNATLDDYAGVLEDGAVFWKPPVEILSNVVDEISG